MLANIDEISITKGVTKNYSWLKAGISSSITTITVSSLAAISF